MTAQTDAALAGDVDLRRFRHVLAPVAQRQQWKLESAQMCLLDAQKQVADAERGLAAIDAEVLATAALATGETGGRIDPQGRRLVLAGLLRLDHERQAQLETLRAREDVLGQARRGCLEAQLRMKGLERHRDEEVRAFALEERRRMAAESDRDWLARRPMTGHVVRRPA